MINYFKVLPTDERFKSLYQDQMVMLYEALNDMPSLSLIKKVTYIIKEKKRIRRRSNDDYISPALENQMKKHLRRSGKSEAEIYKSITEYVARRKQVEIKRLDESFKSILED